MSEKDIHNSRLELVFEKRIPGLRVSEAVRHQKFIMRNRHLHETIELHIIIYGQRLMFVDQETYRLVPHTAIAVNHHLIHKTSTAPNMPPDHHNFILQLDKAVFDEKFREFGLKGFDEFGDLYGGLAKFNDTEWSLIMSVIEEFKAACDDERRGMTSSMEDLHSFLYLQAIELAGIFAKSRRRDMQSKLQEQGIETAEQQSVVKTGVHQKVRDIAIYLQGHTGENVTLDDLAGKFYMSKSYLTRVFRNVTGFSVVEYMTYVRVRKAQQLLRDSDTSITEIAAICGFGNITYFEKVFKQMTGHSPGKYRKNPEKDIMIRLKNVER
ncbi:helix-turn-helix transcriptional regulator [Oribacterium sp. WCC10]|uniref:helix-turn-helix transcriptional regulator n=1 Tax=Oribacterium sp. WCC10 TaxID=1855343 RepID=UPI0008E04B01|nr:AraC family transcriptional regulator [Oribacterium sp. WCC10]SFG53931.1 AraC-type DNA-binding protein [Oribacterium sp. WCC10]